MTQYINNISAGRDVIANVNSDNSEISSISSNDDIKDAIKNIKSIAEANIDVSKNLESIRLAIKTLEDSIGRPNFLDSYKNFISCAADHMALFAPFIPAISKYLVGS